MRVCDLLLFAVSSKETPDNVKIVSTFSLLYSRSGARNGALKLVNFQSFILPLLRATKKMVVERKNEDSTKKLIELVNIMAHLKKVRRLNVNYICMNPLLCLTIIIVGVSRREDSALNRLSN